MQIQWCIQYRDYEEGNCAMWHELANSRHDTQEAARTHLRRIRATDSEENMCAYRITIVDSDEYYSQPTDKLEY